MPIKTSAKKALRQSHKRSAKNKIAKKDLRKTLKSFNVALSAKETEKAKSLMPLVQKKLDKATKQGLIKKNTASRKKSRLAVSLKKTLSASTDQ